MRAPGRRLELVDALVAVLVDPIDVLGLAGVHGGVVVAAIPSPGLLTLEPVPVRVHEVSATAVLVDAVVGVIVRPGEHVGALVGAVVPARDDRVVAVAVHVHEVRSGAVLVDAVIGRLREPGADAAVRVVAVRAADLAGRLSVGIRVDEVEHRDRLAAIEVAGFRHVRPLLRDLERSARTEVPDPSTVAATQTFLLAVLDELHAGRVAVSTLHPEWAPPAAPTGLDDAVRDARLLVPTDHALDAEVRDKAIALEARSLELRVARCDRARCPGGPDADEIAGLLIPWGSDPVGPEAQLAICRVLLASDAVEARVGSTVALVDLARRANCDGGAW